MWSDHRRHVCVSAANQLRRAQRSGREGEGGDPVTCGNVETLRTPGRGMGGMWLLRRGGGANASWAITTQMVPGPAPLTQGWCLLWTEGQRSKPCFAFGASGRTSGARARNPKTGSARWLIEWKDALVRLRLKVNSFQPKGERGERLHQRGGGDAAEGHPVLEDQPGGGGMMPMMERL